MDLDGQIGEGRNGIDAAGAQQNEPGIPAFAGFEQIDGAAQVVLDQLAGGAFAIDPGEHAGIGGAVDDPVEGADCLQVARLADVAVDDPDAQSLKIVAIQPRTGARKVVDAMDLEVAGGGLEGLGELASDKAADSGDEEAHGKRILDVEFWMLNGKRKKSGRRR